MSLVLNITILNQRALQTYRTNVTRQQVLHLNALKKYKLGRDFVRKAQIEQALPRRPKLEVTTRIKSFSRRSGVKKNVILLRDKYTKILIK